MSNQYMAPKLIIGFTGRKQSGKSSSAIWASNLLHARGYTCHLIGFADALKQELANLFNTEVSWIEERKTWPSMRWILQHYGTEFRRGQDVNYWTDKMNAIIAERLSSYREADTNMKACHAILIPDVRFSNECEWIKKQGGYIINIRRPDTDKLDTHASEQCERLPFDAWIDNERTHDGLKFLVGYALNEIGVL